MITVTVERKNQKITGITAKGHALYDEPGSDIVCAAVSALMINAANSLEQLTDDDLVIEEDPDEGGRLRIALEGEISREADILMRSLLLGLESIQQNYTNSFLTIREQD